MTPINKTWLRQVGFEDGPQGSMRYRYGDCYITIDCGKRLWLEAGDVLPQHDYGMKVFVGTYLDTVEKVRALLSALNVELP